MPPLPCPDLHPALLQSIPTLQPVKTSLEIHKQGVGERSEPHSLYCIIFSIALVHVAGTPTSAKPQASPQLV